MKYRFRALTDHRELERMGFELLFVGTPKEMPYPSEYIRKELKYDTDMVATLLENYVRHLSPLICDKNFVNSFGVVIGAREHSHFMDVVVYQYDIYFHPDRIDIDKNMRCAGLFRDMIAIMIEGLFEKQAAKKWRWRAEKRVRR